MPDTRYHRGAHTVLLLEYHFVWKTKYSYSVLRGELALRLRDMLREISCQNGLRIVRGHVRSNHVHLLVRAPSHLSVAKIAQYLKGKSSYLLQREFPDLRKRYWGQHIWSRGYFCATVGVVTEELIKQYIDNQNDSPDGFKVWDEQNEQRDSSSQGAPLG